MSSDDPAGNETGTAPFDVLGGDEENALGAIRMAVAGIRDQGRVADLASIVRAVVEAGGAADGPEESGSRRLRLGEARFLVEVRPADGGRVGVDFGPARP